MGFLEFATALRLVYMGWQGDGFEPEFLYSLKYLNEMIDIYRLCNGAIGM